MSAIETLAPHSSYTPTTTAAPVTEPEPVAQWSVVTRIAFRASCLYFGLYVLSTQMLAGLLPFVPFIRVLSPPPRLFAWVGVHVLGIANVPIAASGSGDKLVDWLQSFTLLLVAAMGTVVWSLMARRRQAHPRVYTWFRLFMRFALGTTLISYGMAKVIPTQMPILALARLVEPFGNFSPMGVLWYSVGASPAYEIITGCAETAAGLLLFWPRTATLGALMSLMDMSMVFILNMTYDVPVKLFSFHLVVMSLVLLAPHARQLFDLFVLHRGAVIPAEPWLAKGRTARRISVWAQVVFGALALGLVVQQGIRGWHTYGGGAPRSPVFGIWDVSEMSIDGVSRPALLTDTLRLRRVIFQQPTSAQLQRMNDSLMRFSAIVDTAKHTIALTPTGSEAITMTFTYAQTAAGPFEHRMTMDGSMDGHIVHLELTPRALNSFLIRTRGFHWIQEAPFNR